eukprot:6175288-Pleurochrysis_carterae.AAC.2
MLTLPPRSPGDASSSYCSALSTPCGVFASSAASYLSHPLFRPFPSRLFSSSPAPFRLSDSLGASLVRVKLPLSLAPALNSFLRSPWQPSRPLSSSPLSTYPVNNKRVALVVLASATSPPPPHRWLLFPRACTVCTF